MKLRKRIEGAIREWLRPDRAERSLARKALSFPSVERAGFGDAETKGPLGHGRS